MRYISYFLLFIIYIICTQLLYGVERADSLERAIQHVKNDTTKVRLLSELGLSFWTTSQEKLFKYNTESIELAEQLNYEEGKIKGLIGLGVFYWQKGEYTTAYDHYFNALTLARKYKNLRGQANALGNLGTLFKEQGEHSKAQDYYLQSIKIYEKIGHEEGKAEMLSKIGVIFRIQKKFNLALENFNEAIKIFEKLNNMQSQAGTISNLASIYFDQEDYDKARKYQKQALAIFEKLNDTKGIILCTNYIGHCFLNEGKPSLAIPYYEKALELNKELVSKKFLLTSFIGLGEAYWKKKDYDESIRYYSLATEVAEKNKIKPSLMNIYTGLFNIYAEKGDFKQAFHFQKLFQKVKDSVYNEESSKKLAQLEASFELTKKQTQIDLLAKDQKIQALAINKQKLVNYFSLAGIGLLIAVSLVTYNKYEQKKKSNNLLAAQKEEIQAQQEQIELFNKQLRLQALRAQMDPHFIFNSLNAIQHFITINDGESSLKYLSKFSKLIRQILENAHKRQLSLQDELVFLDYYLQLEKLRFNDKFTYKIEVDESIDTSNTEIPTLLLQPYLENSIVHGIMHKDKGEISLQVKNEEDYLLCVIEDNGIGRKKALELKNAKTSLHKSRGMIVNKERLDIINEGIEEKVSIEIIDLEDGRGEALGTRVEIKIPIDQN